MSSTTNTTDGAKADTNSTAPPGRRGSQEGTMFSGLMNQKRNSVDAGSQARRQSFADQKPATGVIGQMWQNFTKGDSTK